jgi:hypothetical protein
MLTVLLVWMSLAVADSPNIQETLADGVRVDWSALTLEAHGEGRPRGTETLKAVEQKVRRQVEIALRQGVDRVRVDDETTCSDLDSPAMQEAIRTRVSRWTATKVTYTASGGVQLLGQLKLQDLLKPLTLARAKPLTAEMSEPRYTGIIVDARGLDVSPAWFSRLLDDRGGVLFDGFLWDAEAVTLTPTVWVGDPRKAPPDRVGEDPISLAAVAADGSDLVLAAEDAVRFRTSLQRARLTGLGTLVVVIDP